MTEEIIRLREEITLQILALKALKKMVPLMVLIWVDQQKLLKKQSNGHILHT